MKKYIFITTMSLLGLAGCGENKVQEQYNAPAEQQIVQSDANPVSIDELIANLEDSHNDQVIVVAHRGDWRNAPENSLQAIQNCIDMGVDMVEIDVRQTKDGQLVLMHDVTVDRTTTGTGKVSELTWEYLQGLQLMRKG